MALAARPFDWRSPPSFASSAGGRGGRPTIPRRKAAVMIARRVEPSMTTPGPHSGSPTCSSTDRRPAGPPDEDVTGHVGSCEAQLVWGPQQSTQGMRTGDGQLHGDVRRAKLTAVPTRQVHRSTPAQTSRDQRGHDIRHSHTNLFHLTIDDQDNLG